MTEGTIRVTVQTTERMAAIITELAHAINKLASALTVVPRVQITDCNFKGGEPVISVDTMQEIMTTMIETVE